MMEQICFNCASLMGCPFLADKKGVFNEGNVIDETDHPGSCPQWVPVNQAQKDVRAVLYGIQGAGCLRVLHQVPSMIMEQLIEKEGMDEMNLGEMPDLTSMLYEGMTTAEREEQLRYETDEDGNVVLINDETKRPRPSYQLRKFACDPEGHIQLDHSVGMFWTNDQIIRHVLAAEVEQGLIHKPKKGKIKPSEEETSMGKEGRRVLINRGGKGKGSTGPKTGGPAPGKVSKPPARKGANKGPAAEQEAEAPPAEAAPAGFDVQALLQDIQVAVGETIAGVTEELKKELMARIAEAESKCIDAITIHYDMGVQTGGTYSFPDDNGVEEKLPEMFENENRILGYLSEDPS